jgi:hypothetical protein
LNNRSNNDILFPEFIYDNRRICTKIYLLFKIAGLILCYVTDLFLATLNSIRYEYAHFKRYGTIFSINEFDEWKRKLYPRSRIAFSIIELIIKIVFFFTTYIHQYHFRDICVIGESILKIHILVILSLYIIIGILSFCFFITFSFTSKSQLVVSSPPLPILNDVKNEECIICLDIDNANSWTILQCSHKFHSQCISIWLRTNQTCPICRIRIE